jgi:hypothetical protein
MAKISFDYDNTLTRPDVKEFAMSLMQAGHDIIIVTKRFDEEHIPADYQTHYTYASTYNQDVFRVALLMGIEDEDVHST